MSNKLDFFDKIVFATKEQMTTWKFWESMGGYGRRHPPTPEATEDKSAAHTQYCPRMRCIAVYIIPSQGERLLDAR